jgi:hypothetical protein
MTSGVPSGDSNSRFLRRKNIAAISGESPSQAKQNMFRRPLGPT